MYYLFRLATIILPWIPINMRFVLARVIGWLAWLHANQARKQATKNILHVLGKETLKTPSGKKLLLHTVQKMFEYNVLNYLELFALPSLTPERILRTLSVEGSEHVETALARGKGLILISAHLGPFNYLIHYMSYKGYHVTVPVEHLKDQRMLDLILKLRQSHGVQFIPLEGSSTVRSIMQKLRQNQIVLITADRAIQGQSIEMPFFDALARLPIGPALLAQRTGAALIGGFGWHVSGNDMFAQFLPISLNFTGEPQAKMHSMVRAITEKVEQVIKAHPEQWVMFAPVWVEDLPKDHS